MNPALLMALMPLAEKLIGGGKLDGLLGRLGLGEDGTAAAKEALAGAGTPEAVVLGAITALAIHAPRDPAKAAQYAEAVSQIALNVAKLKASLEGPR